MNGTTLYSVAFWKGAADRAIRAVAWVLISAWSAESVGLLDVDWAASLSMAGMAAVMSMLASIGAAPLGSDGSTAIIPGAK